MSRFNGSTVPDAGARTHLVVDGHACTLNVAFAAQCGVDEVHSLQLQVQGRAASAPVLTDRMSGIMAPASGTGMPALPLAIIHRRSVRA